MTDILPKEVIISIVSLLGVIFTGVVSYRQGSQKSKVDESSSVFDALRKEVDSLRERVDEQQGRIDELSSMLRKSERDYNDLDIKTSIQINNLKRDLDSSEKECARLTIKLDRVKDERDELRVLTNTAGLEEDSLDSLDNIMDLSRAKEILKRNKTGNDNT